MFSNLAAIVEVSGGVALRFNVANLRVLRVDVWEVDGE